MPTSQAHKALLRGQCACAANTFVIEGEPLLRAVCHCYFCQQFNAAPQADILVYRHNQVLFKDDKNTRYRAFKKPELVQRGSCTKCGKPVLEQLHLPLYPQLTFVPTVNHPASQNLPEPALHMFYHRRVADVDDDIPKYNSFLSSELSFMGRLSLQLLRLR